MDEHQLCARLQIIGVSVWELNPTPLPAEKMSRVTFRATAIPMHAGLVHRKNANVKDFMCPAGACSTLKMLYTVWPEPIELCVSVHSMAEPVAL